MCCSPTCLLSLALCDTSTSERSTDFQSLNRSCPTLGLACVLMSRPISPGLVLFLDFLVSNIPWYFSFAR